MTTRSVCAACAHPNPSIFLDLGKTPLANKFPTWLELGRETWHPLQLGRCDSCGLVQIMAVIPDEEIYGDDYGYYSGASEAQIAYQSQSAHLLIRRHLQSSATADPLVVEVACNDGTMLRSFVERGYKSLGIDPARPAQDAIDAGLPVLKKAFTSIVAREIRDEFGPATLVIAYNSLAHVGDLADVLLGIWELLARDGVAVVEVQYLPDLLVGNMYDQVYHEHRYYHSLSSFKRAAELHQLFVVDAELIELQGGGIRITLSPDATRQPAARVQEILWKERWLADDGTFASTQGRIERVRDHLLELLAARDGDVVGYGAAAKATTILNFCGITLPCVIDTTPYKQGRLVPGTGIPIVAEAESANRLLLVPNYLAHVLKLPYSGRWIVPLPVPVKI